MKAASFRAQVLSSGDLADTATNLSSHKLGKATHRSGVLSNTLTQSGVDNMRSSQISQPRFKLDAQDPVTVLHHSNSTVAVNPSTAAMLILSPRNVQ